MKTLTERCPWDAVRKDIDVDKKPAQRRLECEKRSFWTIFGGRLAHVDE
jgi:hypothetical protein